MEWWQWLLSAMGVAAFLMAISPFLQMIYGKPKLRIGFDIRELEQARVLQCNLSNPPITRGILKLLCIRRMPAEDIIASFSISLEEFGNERVIFTEVPHIITYDGTAGAQRINLPPSIFPAHFPIITVMDTEKKAKVFGKDITLLPGEYFVNVEVTMVDKNFEAKRRFVISQTHPFAYWKT